MSDERATTQPIEVQSIEAAATRPILLLVAVAFCALSVWLVLTRAVEVVILLFMAALLACFLVNSSKLVMSKLPCGYHASLGLVIVSLLSLSAGVGLFCRARLQSQLPTVQRELTDSLEAVEGFLEERPWLHSQLSSVPILNRYLDRGEDPEWDDGRTPPMLRRPRTDLIPSPTPAPSLGPDLGATPAPSAPSSSGEGAQGDAAAAAPEGAAAPLTPLAPASAPHFETDSLFRVMDVTRRLLSTSFGLLASSFLVVFMGCFGALDPVTYRRGLISLVSPRHREWAAEVWAELSTSLWRWTLGRLFSMAVVGTSTAAILWALDVPLPVLVGLVTALLTFIPNLGPTIALALALLLALPRGMNTVGLVFVLYSTMQFLETNVLTPIVQRRQVSVPPGLLLATQLLIGSQIGFLGLIVATPVLVVTMILVRRVYVERFLEKRADAPSSAETDEGHADEGHADEGPGGEGPGDEGPGDDERERAPAEDSSQGPAPERLESSAAA